MRSVRRGLASRNVFTASNHGSSFASAATSERERGRFEAASPHSEVRKTSASRHRCHTSVLRCSARRRPKASLPLLTATLYAAVGHALPQLTVGRDARDGMHMTTVLDTAATDELRAGMLGEVMAP